MFTNPIHADEKPAIRTSDCGELTRYGFPASGYIANVLIERPVLEFRVPVE
jgi:hypothetical protein